MIKTKLMRVSAEAQQAHADYVTAMQQAGDAFDAATGPARAVYAAARKAASVAYSAALKQARERRE